MTNIQQMNFESENEQKTFFYHFVTNTKVQRQKKRTLKLDMV